MTPYCGGFDEDPEPDLMHRREEMIPGQTFLTHSGQQALKDAPIRTRKHPGRVVGRRCRQLLSRTVAGSPPRPRCPLDAHEGEP